MVCRSEDLRRQPADRIQHRIGRHHAIMLRGDQRDARVDQRLLRVEHVERGALAGLGFFAHAVERDLGGRDLRLRRCTCALPASNWPHAVHDVGAGLVAGCFEVEALLRQRFLGLADQRIFGAALIDRYGSCAIAEAPNVR